MVSDDAIERGSYERHDVIGRAIAAVAGDLGDGMGHPGLTGTENDTSILRQTSEQ
jgi:hypothetical protein